MLFKLIHSLIKVMCPKLQKIRVPNNWPPWLIRLREMNIYIWQGNTQQECLWHSLHLIKFSQTKMFFSTTERGIIFLLSMCWFGKQKNSYLATFALKLKNFFSSASPNTAFTKYKMKQDMFTLRFRSSAVGFVFSFTEPYKALLY